MVATAISIYVKKSKQAVSHDLSFVSDLTSA